MITKELLKRFEGIWFYLKFKDNILDAELASLLLPENIYLGFKDKEEFYLLRFIYDSEKGIEVNFPLLFKNIEDYNLKILNVILKLDLIMMESIGTSNNFTLVDLNKYLKEKEETNNVN